MPSGMSRVVLITDTQTGLGEELVKNFRSSGYRLVAVSTGAVVTEALATETLATETVGTEETEGPLEGSIEEDMISIRWHRSSPVSARNVLLNLRDSFDRLDEALLLHSPRLDRNLLQENSPAAIEQAVDNWIKGSLFMVKEILGLYKEQDSGVLNLVSYCPRNESAFPPLEGTIRGGFHALAESLFAGNGSADMVINGFESYAPDPSAYADYIFNKLTERKNRSSGKWFRFQVPISRLLGRR